MNERLHPSTDRIPVSRGRKGSENYLPEHLGIRFVDELVNLVDKLAENGDFKSTYLQSELLSKYCDSTTTSPELRRTAAIRKWRLAEERNRRTNTRLLLGDVDFGWAHSDKVLGFAKELIRGVLGPLANADLATSNHTNGASTRIRRSPKGAILKYSGIAHATEAALPHWSRVSQDTLLEDQVVTVVPGSVLFTVPKKSDIDRVACKEPEINLFLQRAVGNHIRQRMRRRPSRGGCGIDLNDQTVNQELARTAVDDGLATIDLSSASDSISVRLVFELLPYEWFAYLDDIRSHQVDVDGSLVELEMFSSMGNGFTFELESLIFWALTRSVARFSGVKGRISVYGDDIIAPSRLVPRLIRLFSWCGFTINREKSAWRGPFRESCGKHYYSSLDVSPFYIREPVRSKTDLIRLLNRLMEWCGRSYGFIPDDLVYEFHRKWSEHIPRSLWGGQDPDDITSLVTGHAPRKRLLERTRDIRGPSEDIGAYLHWFCTKQVIGTEVSIEVTSRGRWCITRQPSYVTRTTWTPWLAYTE